MDPAGPACPKTKRPAKVAGGKVGGHHTRTASPRQRFVEGPKADVARPSQLDGLLTPHGSLVDFYPAGAFRPEGWRWQLGLLLARGGRVPRDWIDPWVKAARGFAAALAADPSGDPLLALRARFPAEVEAAALQTLAPAAARWEVEARVLAGQSAPEIAAATGVPAAAVEAYESWFFGVRDRLRASAYVMHVVIGWYAAGGNPTEKLWKFFAYRGGPTVLEALIRGPAAGRRPPETPAQVACYLDADLLDRLRLRTAVLVHTAPVNETTAPQWARLAARTAADRGKPPPSAGTAAAMSPNIRAMWDAVPWWRPGAGTDSLAGKPAPAPPDAAAGAPHGG